VEASRPARPDDVARIVEMARLMRAELGVMKGGQRWLDRDAWREPIDDAYRALIERSDALVVVGTIDDVALGYAAVVLEPVASGRTIGVVTDLYVEPEAREVGVGEAMLTELVDFAREQECVGIDALALPGHRAAKNFFEEQGFTARALVMHHSLDPAAPSRRDP
jgi:ribosomal protein S18 acetylase RimI-like enzyme